MIFVARVVLLGAGVWLSGCGAGATPVANSPSDPSNPDAEQGAAPLEQVKAEAAAPAGHGHHGHAHHAHSAAAEAAEYTCPHHPEVVSDKPGICPKCKMDLEPKEG